MAYQQRAHKATLTLWCTLPPLTKSLWADPAQSPLWPAPAAMIQQSVCSALGVPGLHIFLRKWGSWPSFKRNKNTTRHILPCISCAFYFRLMRFQKTRSERVSQVAEQELTVCVRVHERIHASVYGDGRQGDTCSKCQAGILHSHSSPQPPLPKNPAPFSTYKKSSWLSSLFNYP